MDRADGGTMLELSADNVVAETVANSIQKVGEVPFSIKKNFVSPSISGT